MLLSYIGHDNAVPRVSSANSGMSHQLPDRKPVANATNALYIGDLNWVNHKSFN
jgi:hypothetical protein